MITLTNIILTFFVVFHIAIVLGWPLGSYAYGGFYPKELPNSLRVMSGIAIVIFILSILVLNYWENWWMNLFFLGLFSLSTIGNIITKSSKERYLMLPLSSFLVLTFLLQVV